MDGPSLSTIFIKPENDYVHGMSLTHGQNPYKHTWTFAAAKVKAQDSIGINDAVQ